MYCKSKLQHGSKGYFHSLENLAVCAQLTNYVKPSDERLQGKEVQAGSTGAARMSRAVVFNL